MSPSAWIWAKLWIASSTLSFLASHCTFFSGHIDATEESEQEIFSTKSLETGSKFEETYSGTLGYEGEAYHQKHGRDILHAPSGAKAFRTFGNCSHNR